MVFTPIRKSKIRRNLVAQIKEEPLSFCFDRHNPTQTQYKVGLEDVMNAGNHDETIAECRSSIYRQIIDYLVNHTKSIKRAAVVGATVIITSVALTGCQGWVPTIGNYPLGHCKAKNERIAERQNELYRRYVTQQMRLNTEMGGEPDEGIRIPLFGFMTYN